MLRARIVLIADGEEIEQLNLRSETPLPIFGEKIVTEAGTYIVTDITHRYRESEEEISEPRINVHVEPDSDAN
ncbi:hypothetical protein GRS48_14015 [Halorubrum sp. JWXQ-INN 858]|uniref:hypothetical protein n=1 Tax=Halorubrum sp. JWXQ-INN 858 TaxID=2690782 RepID=UPI001358680A|nr:hypothetical protein [Halorubrum sp. JWXQ-INN 858]MWV65926.1 hypothetical protein [Halorubrum sp. JWXQ-INN 858]